MKYNISEINTILLCATLTLFVCCCSGQASNKEVDLTINDSIEQKVKSINQEYNLINSNILKYKVIIKDIEEVSSEGGEIKAYFNLDTLRKAISTFYGETGKLSIEYYCKANEIIFIYEREERYELPIYEGKTKVKSIQESRYYFYNSKLIRWTGNDGNIVDQIKYISKETELFEGLKEINDILLKQSVAPLAVVLQSIIAINLKTPDYGQLSNGKESESPLCF